MVSVGRSGRHGGRRALAQGLRAGLFGTALFTALFSTVAARAETPRFGAPALAATEESSRAALGFSNLVVRLDNDRIGLAGEDYRVHILEALRAAGVNAVGAENLVFDQDDSESADYVLGGTVRELECLSVARRVNCRVGIEWQVLDLARRSVVYKVLSRHAEYGLVTDSKVSGRRLVMGALRSLTSRPEFRRVLSKAASAPDQSYATATFGACPAHEVGMPAGFEEAARATVLIKTSRGFGSGFFLGNQGLVLTAAHVVDGPVLELQLRDRSVLKARPIRVSRAHDVALLMVEGGANLPCLDLNPGPKSPGSDVYAIGAPASLELAFSLSRGILSGIRSIDGVELLQTDTSLSPGNSGGPLIDANGRVLGVVSRKLAGSAVEGVGFAIPIESALGALKLQAAPQGDPELLRTATVPLEVDARASVFVDTPDSAPSLDPEADAAREAWKESRDRERQREAEERELDARTPGYVKVMRWGGLGLAAGGAIVAGASALAFSKDEMTESDYESLRTYNDLGWVALGAGGAAFGVSFLLTPSKPAAKAAVTTRVQLTSGGANLVGDF